MQKDSRVRDEGGQESLRWDRLMPSPRDMPPTGFVPHRLSVGAIPAVRDKWG